MADGIDEYPEQTYFPSWKVRLWIRFDEFGDTGPIRQKTKTKITTKWKGTTDPDGAKLAVGPDPDAPPGVSRLLVGSGGASSAVGKATADTSSDDLTKIVGGVIPIQASLGLNGVRVADTLKIDLKYADIPIDPRVVRSCRVQFFLGTVTADDFAAGMAGTTRGDLGASGADAGDPLSVIGDVDHRGVSTLRFDGWVDEWETEWPSDGEPIVHLDCRDHTQLFIDTDAPPKLVLDPKAPIDRAIATYLANFPQYNGFAVEYRPGGVSIPKLGDSLGPKAYPPQLGPAPSKGGGGGSKLSVWDYLTDVAGTIGHLVRVEGSVVIVQRARELLKAQAAGRDDDPFAGRTLPSGRQITNRQMIYGRNLDEMRISRKFSRYAPQNIEVRCYNAGNKTTLVERFPLPNDPAGQLTGRALPGDGTNEQKWFVVRVSGVRDKKTLRIIAQGIYESMGRNELGIHLRTKNLASFGGGNLDPDLLDMKAGDAFELLVHRDDPDSVAISSTTNQLEGLMLLQAKAADFLRHVGYSDDFAEAYGKAYASANFQTAFRVRSMGVSCTNDDGDAYVTIEVDGVNFIEVRNDRLLPDGEEISSAETAGAPKKQTGKSGGPGK